MDLFKALSDELGFKEIELDTMQSVSSMTIVPILGKDLTDSFASPEKVRFLKTTNYGSMTFVNEDEEKTGFMPSNIQVTTKVNAQDHCMSEHVIIPNKSKKTYDNACCIQQHTGGYMHDSDLKDYNIVPLGVKKALTNQNLREKKDYSKLWTTLLSWTSGVVNTHGGELNPFFTKYKKELEDFVAEFEPVRNQLGALIFYNGKLVGIEILPTNAHWEYFWKWIIRGCYGSELIRRTVLGQIQVKKIEYIKKDDLDLEVSVDNAIKKLQDEIIQNNEINDISSYLMNHVINLNLNGKVYAGEFLKKSEKPLYLSVCF